MHSLYKKGFTLIELMVVIAIIAILSSIIVTSVGAARAAARDGRRVADLKNLQLKLQQYHTEKGGYPATLAELAPTYIPVVPTDAGDTAQSYTYTVVPTNCVSTACTGYTLAATLENKKNDSFTYSLTDPYRSLQ